VFQLSIFLVRTYLTFFPIHWETYPSINTPNPIYFLSFPLHAFTTTKRNHSSTKTHQFLHTKKTEFSFSFSFWRQPKRNKLSLVLGSSKKDIPTAETCQVVLVQLPVTLASQKKRKLITKKKKTNQPKHSTNPPHKTKWVFSHSLSSIPLQW